MHPGRPVALSKIPVTNAQRPLTTGRPMLTVYDQPIRYGSRRPAKSRSIFTAIKGPTSDDPHVHRWHVACFGNRSHYERETGICAHVEETAAHLDAWHRARTWFQPFGSADQKERRL